jgi:hypothetical protein
MRDLPYNHSDLLFMDDFGRRLDVSLFEGLAIYYWIDAADHHIKVLEIVAGD